MYNLRVYTSLHGIVNLLLKFQPNVLWRYEMFKLKLRGYHGYKYISFDPDSPQNQCISFALHKEKYGFINILSSYTAPDPFPFTVLRFPFFQSQFVEHRVAPDWDCLRQSGMLQRGDSFAETEDLFGSRGMSCIVTEGLLCAWCYSLCRAAKRSDLQYTFHRRAKDHSDGTNRSDGKKAQWRYEKACGVIRRHFPCIALCAWVTADRRKEETTLYIAQCREESSVTGQALRQECRKKETRPSVYGPIFNNASLHVKVWKNNLKVIFWIIYNKYKQSITHSVDVQTWKYSIY